MIQHSLRLSKPVVDGLEGLHVRVVEDAAVIVDQQ